MLGGKMAKDLNHDIPVQGTSYSGSDRAKKAMGAAHQAPMHKPLVGESVTSTATQSDQKTGNFGNKAMQGNKDMTSPMRPVPNMAKPPMGATPPNQINPAGRPGLGGNPVSKKGRY
jgi:hypothetical protein